MNARTAVINDDPRRHRVPGRTTLAQVVDEFVATLSQHGIVIDRQSVELEMRDRIADIAERLRADPETVLRDHVSLDWGRQMASGVLDQIRNERLLDAAGPPEDRPVRIAG
jgi:hypothetical protein